MRFGAIHTGKSAAHGVHTNALITSGARSHAAAPHFQWNAKIAAALKDSVAISNSEV